MGRMIDQQLNGDLATYMAIAVITTGYAVESCLTVAKSTSPEEGTMKRRNRIKVARLPLSWLSNLSVGLVVGGALALMLSNNLVGLLPVYVGIAIAYILFKYLKEDD